MKPLRGNSTQRGVMFWWRNSVLALLHTRRHFYKNTMRCKLPVTPSRDHLHTIITEELIGEILHRRARRFLWWCHTTGRWKRSKQWTSCLWTVRRETKAVRAWYEALKMVYHAHRVQPSIVFATSVLSCLPKHKMNPKRWLLLIKSIKRFQ